MASDYIPRVTKANRAVTPLGFTKELHSTLKASKQQISNFLENQKATLEHNINTNITDNISKQAIISNFLKQIDELNGKGSLNRKENKVNEKEEEEMIAKIQSLDEKVKEEEENVKGE